MFVVRGVRTIKQTKHFRLKKVYCFLEFLFFLVSICEMNVQGDQLWSLTFHYVGNLGFCE